MTLFQTLILTSALALGLQAGAEGASSKVLLQTGTTWNGAPIQYAAAARPEVQSMVIEIPPGASTPWHKHPVNNYAYILEGHLHLELEDKTIHDFKAGEAFAEVVDTWHRGTNTGSTPLKILVFYLGQAGAPLTLLRPEPAH